MSIPRLTFWRSLLIIGMLTVTVVSTVSLWQCRLMPFEVGRTGRQIVISHVTSGGTAEQRGMRSGDILRTINGRTPERLAEALWLTQWVQRGDRMDVTLARNDSVFAMAGTADQRVPLLHLIPDRITALAFLLLGLLVWWRSRGDATVSAFMRVTSVIGVSAMLSGFPNSMPSETGRIIYLAAYVGIRSFIPAVLLDFVFRFTSPRSTSGQRWIRVALYGMSSLACLLSVVSGVGAAVASSPLWLYAFDIANRYVYGISLIAAMLVTFGKLLAAAWRAKPAWEYRQYRWLLLCLVLGATPYVFFVKLSSLFGASSPVSVGIAMAMLLITPVGWGMAVASFRMLHVEWTLSRTIVHLVSAGIIIYLGGSLALLGAEVARANSWFTLLMLGIGGALLLVLAFRTLLERVEWAVDHVYYGDWYDETNVVHDLELKLSSIRTESDLARILTDELSSIVKVHRSLLLIRTSSVLPGDASDWAVAADQPGEHAQVSWSDVLPPKADSTMPHIASNSEPLSNLGYSLAVPLNHGVETLGWLLLGHKVSGAPYGERDYRLLRALSPVAGMALVAMEMNRRILDHERRMVVIDLAGSIAHEIGNALSPLMGQAQLIEHALRQNPERVAHETVAKPLQIIVDMCGRIRRIVQNLSRLSQPILLQKSAFSLNDAAEDALQLMTETAGRIKRFQDASREADTEQSTASYRLRRELSEDLPLLTGDAQQLSQVFMNLIINAADAMESDGHGLLAVGTMRSFDPPGVIGFVEDTGPGIDPGAMDKIFQPYFTTKPKGQGIGLGLTFVRSIIEAHHGLIRVRAAHDRGTRFEFFLPASPTVASEPDTVMVETQTSRGV